MISVIKYDDGTEEMLPGVEKVINKNPKQVTIALYNGKYLKRQRKSIVSIACTFEEASHG